MPQTISVKDAGGTAVTVSTLDAVLAVLPAALVGGRLAVDGSGATQPVSASALPLPAGASTEATLSALSAKTPALVGGAVPSALAAAAAGGCSTLHRVGTADANSVSVKASAGQLYGVQVTNANAAARYLKLYDSATAPTAGAGTPKKVLCVPGGTPAQPTVVLYQQPNGVPFAAGIGLTVVAGLADTDATAVTAGDLLVEVDFK